MIDIQTDLMLIRLKTTGQRRMEKKKYIRKDSDGEEWWSLDLDERCVSGSDSLCVCVYVCVCASLLTSTKADEV